MKTKTLWTIFLGLVLLSITWQQAFAQINELSWNNLYGGKQHEMTMGFTKDSVNYYLPVTFTDSISIDLNGSDTVIYSKGGIDAVVLTVNQDGQATNYRHFSNKGDLSITRLAFRNGNLVVVGSFQDSLKIITQLGEEVFIASTVKPLDSYIIEISPENEVLLLSTSPEQTKQAYFNYLVLDQDRLFAYGTAMIDTLSEPQVMFFSDSAGQSSYSFPCSSVSMEIKSIGFANNNIVFSGSYQHGHLFGQDTLLAFEAQDAFFAYGDVGYTDITFRTFNSTQDAIAASFVANGNDRWIAISFADTLFIPNDQSFVSEGSVDVLLIQMDSLFSPVNYYQFSGIMYEKADNLFVHQGSIYFLANVSSPIISVYKNGILVQEVTQDNLLGNASLFTIDPSGSINLVWMVSNNWIGSIVSVDKFSETETVLSGNFHGQIKIDSSYYQSAGGMDVFMMRISDICLNTMKSSAQYINFCEGDSLQLLNYKPDVAGKLIPVEYRYEPFYISKDVTYWLENVAECGCITTDSVSFRTIKRAEISNEFKNGILGETSISINQDNILLVSYCGECSLSENQYSIFITPNPTGNESSLDITLSLKIKIIVEVYSSDGIRLLEIAERDYSKGNHKITLPIGNFPAGNYFVKVQLTGTELSSQKTFKLMKL